jgi:hypothetical protein
MRVNVNSLSKLSTFFFVDGQRDVSPCQLGNGGLMIIGPTVMGTARLFDFTTVTLCSLELLELEDLIFLVLRLNYLLGWDAHRGSDESGICDLLWSRAVVCKELLILLS